VTVVIGVVTVAVVPVGVVTVAVVIGVMTVTVAAGTEIGSVGRDSVGTGRLEGGSNDATTAAVDERADAGAATPPERCDIAGAALAAGIALELSTVSTGLRAESSLSTPPAVRCPAPAIRFPAWATNAAVVSSLVGATARTVCPAATIPPVARPVAATTAAAPFSAATCGVPPCLSHRHNPAPPTAAPSV